MSHWQPDISIAPDLSVIESPDHHPLDHTEISKGDRIGRGGNADVYQASAPDVEPNFAIKEPRIQGTVTKEVIKQFDNEATRWSSIDDHPQIVGVLDWNKSPVPWIALEYMDGGSLRDRLDSADHEIDLLEALWIGISVSQAVRYAHRHGIAHLDLKPSNILFRETPNGTWDVPKVTDWGLAAFLIDHSGSVDGLSPTYAAPEQFDTENFGDPSDFTDIYQLGCVLFELFTGEPPFEGSGVGVMHSHLSEQPPLPTDIDSTLPEELDPVLQQALAKDQHERQETTVELRRELETVFDDIVETRAEKSRTPRTQRSREYTSDESSVTSETNDAGSTPEVQSGKTDVTNNLSQSDERIVELFDSHPVKEQAVAKFAHFAIAHTDGTIPVRTSLPLRLPLDDVYDVDGMGTVLRGTIYTGEIAVGDEVVVQPGAITGTVTQMNQSNEEIDSAKIGETVIISVDGVSAKDADRGSVIGHVDDPPLIPETFVVDVVVQDLPSVLTAGDTVNVHAHSTQVPCTLESLNKKIDPDSGEVLETDLDTIHSGEAATVTVRPQNPLVINRFLDIPELGVVTIRDRGQTVGLGVVREVNGYEELLSVEETANPETPTSQEGVDEYVTGVVDFFNDTGGYGFIESDAVEEDVFFHMEDIDGPDLKEGQEVEITVEHAEKGARVDNLRRSNEGQDRSNETQADGSVTGVVSFFNDTGGYGFIDSDAVDEEVFFHMENVGGPDLEEGQEVEFEIEPSDKGPRAKNLRRL